MKSPTGSMNPTVITLKQQSAFYGNLCLQLFSVVEHMFSITERNAIKGGLRRGDLSVAWSPVVSQKLEEARKTGGMDVKSFAALYQFHSFCRKKPTSGNDSLCKDKGYNKLKAGEASCLVTNMTMSARLSSNHELFDSVKKLIEDILGPVPSDFLTKPEVNFGPGSTVNVDNRSYDETGLFYKLTDRLIVPERAKYYLAALVSSHPNWVELLATHYHTQRNADEAYIDFEMRIFRLHFHIVPDDFPSRIGFVPKDSDEHRAIGIELNGLIPLQKTVGDLIRYRLKRRGIDLDSQDRNRHMARLARTFGLATIDLANASSSISLELVRAIFPKEWMILFDTFRSTHGKSNHVDETLEYQMISSMGNGFTFELESLIFYALASATAKLSGIDSFEAKKSISVFGDDIIIPSRIAPQFFQNLTLFGFTANTEKSFVEGFFFESCGSDYYDGYDVRPFFLKREVITLRDCYFLANAILFRCISTGFMHILPLYTYLFRRIASISSFGPLHFSVTDYGRLKTDDLEAVLRVPLEYAQANGGVKFKTSLSAFVYKNLVRISVDSPLSRSPQYAVMHARYMTFLKGNREGKVVLRGRTKDSIKNRSTSQWDGSIMPETLRKVRFIFDSI